MKEQPINNQLGDGFNFALYLTPPRTNENKETREIEEGLDKMTLGLNLDKNISSIEFSKHPSELKNYINRDLLQKLEEHSPLKSVISSKTNMNSSFLNLNDNNHKEIDQTELLNITEAISSCNKKHSQYEFNDEKISNFEIKPIKINLLENNEQKNETKREEEFNTSISTNINSKLSSFNSPNIFSRDSRVNKKSFTAENKHLPLNFTETSNKNSMFNLPSQSINPESYYHENLHNSRDLNQYNYQSSIFNYQSTNKPNTIPYQPPHNFYTVQSVPNNMNIKNMNYNLVNPNPNYNINNYSKKNDKKKKVFEERAGDWVCMKCKNLNFSFRIICNRCKIPKIDSEKLYDEHIKNLYNYVKINDMYQIQVFSQQNLSQNPHYQMSNTGFTNYYNNFIPNSKPNTQIQGNPNCINLNVYSNESLNSGYI